MAATGDQINTVLDLVEDFWEGPEDGGESGEIIFNKFMEDNRKFFEGPEDEEEEDEFEFEQKLQDVWE